MAVLDNVMEFAARSDPPRLTMISYEEECFLAEQARIAQEQEAKRISDEEAKGQTMAQILLVLRDLQDCLPPKP
jgi:hypothetical protein